MEGSPAMKKGFWHEYILHDYDFARFGRGDLILDLGCGEGIQLAKLIEKGYKAIGLDPGPEPPTISGERPPFVRGCAETLPFRNRRFYGIVCKGVLPFTDESIALSEIGRVVQPNAEVDLMTLGLGYYLRQIFRGSLKFRFYGFRTIVNTFLYSLFNMRLPGFLGDTIYQSERRLAWKFKSLGFELIETTPSPEFLRCPVFIYQRLRKVP